MRIITLSLRGCAAEPVLSPTEGWQSPIVLASHPEPERSEGEGEKQIIERTPSEDEEAVEMLYVYTTPD